MRNLLYDLKEVVAPCKGVKSSTSNLLCSGIKVFTKSTFRGQLLVSRGNGSIGLFRRELGLVRNSRSLLLFVFLPLLSIFQFLFSRWSARRRRTIGALDGVAVLIDCTIGIFGIGIPIFLRVLRRALGAPGEDQEAEDEAAN